MKHFNRIFKSTILAIAGFTFFGTQANAQVTVFGSNLADGSYTTLGAAFTAINANAQTGLSILIGFSGNTTEPATATLNAGAWSSVTIGCSVPVTVSGNIAGAIIKLNGADNVTIDGRISSSGRNITISNTSTAGSSAGIWVSSAGAGAGCTNNIIRNCNISCGVDITTSSSTSFGIISVGTLITNTATSGGADNDNNQYVDNSFTKCRYGIFVNGLTGNLDNNTVISDNLIGPGTFGANNIGKIGIYMGFQNAANVTRNTIQNVGESVTMTATAADRYGISMGTESWTNTPGTGGTITNCTVTRNLIHDVIEEKTFSAVGICVATGTTASANTICSNMIYNVRSNGSAGDQTVGIGVGSGNGDFIVNNSVSITGDLDPGTATAAAHTPCCFRIGGISTTNITVVNNIFYIDVTSNTNVVGTGVEIPATNFAFGTGRLNYIDYYFPATNTFMTTGAVGANSVATTFYTTLANWQAALAPAQNANSVQLDPVFVSATDLHLSLSSANLNNIGTAVACSSDFDNDPRGATPDIGADEYNPTACVAANGGTISPSTRTACAGTTITITSTGATAGLGITYQWMVGTVSGGPYSNVSGGSGATTTSYTTGALVAGTYYYVLQTTCSFGPMTGLSNECTVVVNPQPSVSVTPTSASFCIPGGTPVALTASGTASGYSWSPAAGLSTTVGNTTNASPATTTTYSVTGVDLNGCTAVATTTITVAEYPSVTAVSATPASVCSGGNSQLLVAGGATNSYAVTSIPFAAVATPGSGVTTLANSGTAVTAVSAGNLDDGVWQSQAIPFSFRFYGTTYTSFAVSTNGFIWLGAGAPNTYTGTNNTMPSTIMGHPAIGAVYSDLDWTTNGIINYFTTGTAPNRALVINYQGGRYWDGSPGGTGNVQTQIIIYETSNIIEVHTTATTGWNPQVEGIQNAAGTAAVTVAGRNNTVFVVSTPDAYRWSPNGGTLTYSWSPGTFLSSTAIANPMANGVTATTTYTATVSNSGCSSTGTVTIVSGTALTSTGSISPASSVCQGTNITLNALPAGGGAPYTYSWTGPNSFSSTLQNPPINGVTAVNAGTYTVVITDACTATSSVTVTLAVNSPPTVAITPVSSLYCTGGPGVSLSASGSASTYSWSPSSGLSSTTTANTAASPTATTTYTVIGTDGNGCTNSATTTVTSAPGITGAAATSTPTAVCVGGTVNLNATSNGIPGVILTENFNTGAPAWTRTNTSTGGTPANAAWTDRPDGYVYAAGTPYHSNDNTQFVQTNSDAQGSGSTTRTTLQSPSFSTVGYNTINVNFYQYYRDINDNGDSAVVEASLDGINWTRITQYTASSGSENAFTNQNVALPVTYNNQATVYVRFRYIATWDWYWSIDNVTITGQSNAGFTYAWTSNPVGFTSSIQNPSNTPSASTTYSVVMTTPAGCTASATVGVTVNAPPTVTANASANPVCIGNTETFTGGGAATYTWTGGVTDGVPFTASSSGSYTVTGTDVNGCTNSAVLSLTVNPLPVVAVSGTSPICAGDTALLTGTSGGTSQWYMNGSPIVGATASTYNATAAGVYNMTKTNLNGCADSAATGVTLVVNPLPSVSASSTASVVCSGSPVTVNGSGATSYAWSGGVTDGVAFNPTSTMTYTVTGTDGNGCMDTASISVAVNALPPVVANTTSNAVCSGSPVTLTGSGATSYSWSGGVTDGIAFTPVSTLTYTVTGTDGNGCMNTDSVSVVVNPNPTVMAMSNDSTVCSGDMVTFNGSGASSYTWNNGVTDGVPFAVTAADTFIVTGTDVNGCTGMDSLMIAVNALPTVTLTLPLDTACINLGPVTLSGESPAGGTWSGPGVSGNLYNPGATGSGTFGIMYTYMDSTTGCSATATDSIIADICNGIDAVNGVTVELYPNPNNGEFVLIPGGSGVVDVYIYNAAGQLVSAQQVTCNQPNPIRIDASGMYSIAVVAADGTRTTHRVIVNR